MSEQWPILDYPGRGRAVIEPGPLLRLRSEAEPIRVYRLGRASRAKAGAEG